MNHKTKIVKYNEFLAELTTKNKISLLFFKYKQGNNIHEH